MLKGISKEIKGIYAMLLLATYSQNETNNSLQCIHALLGLSSYAYLSEFSKQLSQSGSMGPMNDGIH